MAPGTLSVPRLVPPPAFQLPSPPHALCEPTVCLFSVPPAPLVPDFFPCLTSLCPYSFCAPPPLPFSVSFHLAVFLAFSLSVPDFLSFVSPITSLPVSVFLLFSPSPVCLPDVCHRHTHYFYPFCLNWNFSISIFRNMFPDVLHLMLSAKCQGRRFIDVFQGVKDFNVHTGERYGK